MWLKLRASFRFQVSRPYLPLLQRASTSTSRAHSKHNTSFNRPQYDVSASIKSKYNLDRSGQWKPECTTPSSSSSALKKLDDNLPIHRGINRKYIHLIDTPLKLQRCMKILNKQTHVGFDSEASPQYFHYAPHQPYPSPPHLVQFSTKKEAFLFTLVSRNYHHHPRTVAAVGQGPPSSSLHLTYQEVIKAIKDILENPRIAKIGFSLEQDIDQLLAGHDIQMTNIIDLGTNKQQIIANYHPDPLQRRNHSLGLITAVKIVMQQSFKKDRSCATKRWCSRLHDLPVRQIIYAANDAYMARIVYVKYVEKKAWLDERAWWDLAEYVQRQVAKEGIKIGLSLHHYCDYNTLSKKRVK